MTSTKTNGTNLSVEVSQGPSVITRSNALADIGTVCLDKPGFPSGKWSPTGLDPGEYLVDLRSVGVNELQAPEIEFLENGVKRRGVGRSVRWDIQSIPWLGATTSLSLKRPQGVAQGYRVSRPPHSQSSLIRRDRDGKQGR